MKTAVEIKATGKYVFRLPLLFILKITFFNIKVCKYDIEKIIILLFSTFKLLRVTFSEFQILTTYFILVDGRAKTFMFALISTAFNHVKDIFW